jgi:hypothetical protein
MCRAISESSGRRISKYLAVLREKARPRCAHVPYCPSFWSYPDGHRRPGCTGGQCTRGCLRDRVGLSNGGNIAPTTRRCRQSMAASACGMISRRLFPTVNYWIDFARHVLAERGAMCPGERRGRLSGAGGRSLVKGEAQQGARPGQRNRPQKLI